MPQSETQIRTRLEMIEQRQVELAREIVLSETERQRLLEELAWWAQPGEPA